MSFVVHRAGGGLFNPRALLFSPDERFFFVGCGSIINIYSLPDFRLVDQRTNHKSKVTSIVCTNDVLVSADSDGNIFFFKFNEITIIDKEPFEVYKHSKPIDKLLIRDDKLFYIYFQNRMFLVKEYGNDNSLFVIPFEVQKELVDINPSIKPANENEWLKFPALDAFDIDKTATIVAVADECKLHIYNLESCKKIADYNVSAPLRMLKFRGPDLLTFTQNGLFQQFGVNTYKDHWHFTCPNDFVFNNTTIYSGGFEGVLLTLNQSTHLHNFLPRVGMTIEGLCLSNNSSYIGVVCDKNILTLIDPSNFIRENISHLTGDISFSNDIIVSLRKPNLLQFFEPRNGTCIEQLQVSSFNSRNPVTHFELANDYLITVEENEVKEHQGLTIHQQVEFNHNVTHANLKVENDKYLNLLTVRRHDEYVKILKMRYMYRKGTNDEINDKTIGANPLVYTSESSDTVGYSEIKIWTRGEKGFELQQSFRIIGNSIASLSVHPTLPVFSIVVNKEIQIWKRFTNWQLLKSMQITEIPKSITWSKDGTILVLSYNDLFKVYDSEELKLLATQKLDNNIISLSFSNDYEIIIQATNSILVYNLKSLSIEKKIFAQADCCSADKDCFAFAINKDVPIVVLSSDNVMKSWNLPTHTPISALKVINAKAGIRIIIVDKDYFIWNIDQFSPEIKEIKKPTIKITKAKDLSKKEVVQIQIDKTQKILEMIENYPSHQVPSIDNLSYSLFSLLIDKKKEKEVPSVSIELEGTNEENEIDAVQPTPSDMIYLRNFF